MSSKGDMQRKTVLAGKQRNFALLSIALVVPVAYLFKWWSRSCNEIVPEPFMDEVCHIPTAQNYCVGNFTYAHPHITTPPALYAISYIAFQFGFGCDKFALRRLNEFYLWLGILPCSLYLFVNRYGANGKPGTLWINLTVDRDVVRALHCALNVCLFPVSFALVAFYYTECGSTAFTLLLLQLRENKSLTTRPWLRSIVLFTLGSIALLWRQTNIIWAVAFPAALDIVTLLKKRWLESPSQARRFQGETLSITKIAQMSWEHGYIYDPPFGDAYTIDFIKLPTSIAIAALRDPLPVVQTLVPYLLVLGGLVAWVVVHGSVVVSHAENHVAQIHVPQILYLWGALLVFGLPLIAPRVLALLMPPRYLSVSLRQTRPQDPKSALPHMSVIVMSFAIMLGAVHYNTIIHQFSLANPRSYTFYFFRRIRIYPWLKYALTPIYGCSAWGALLVLGLPQKPSSEQAKLNTGSHSNAEMIDTQQELAFFTDERGSKTSYVVIWLICNIFCLVTVPLVDPRYYIMPWITWRLGVASVISRPISTPSADSNRSASLSQDGQTSPNSTQSLAIRLLRVLDHGEHLLYLETLWFFMINGLFMYIFLYRPFLMPEIEAGPLRFFW